MKSKDLQPNRPVSCDLQSIRPDMHHQKTLQFLQILQIGSGLVLSWCPHHERLLTIEDPRTKCVWTGLQYSHHKRDRRATLAIPRGHDVTESSGKPNVARPTKKLGSQTEPNLRKDNPYYEKKSGLPPSSEGRGGHQDQFAKAFVGHAAEDALVQPGRLAGCGHDGWEFGVIAIVD